MGGTHEAIVNEQWKQLLKSGALERGNLYFFQGGRCVGNIRHVRDFGTYVRFYFNWSGQETSRGWVRRNYKHYQVTKRSLRNVERGKPAELGDNTTLYWAGALDLNEGDLRAPTSRNSPKGPKKERPLPLFDR